MEHGLRTRECKGTLVQEEFGVTEYLTHAEQVISDNPSTVGLTVKHKVFANGETGEPLNSRVNSKHTVYANVKTRN